MRRFKRILSTITSITLFVGMFTIPARAEVIDGGYSYVADKTAQWAAQEKGTYDMRIHGWETWETAAYMGFTLSEGFSTEMLEKAELVVNTQSATSSGTAYIYAADYSAFTNGGHYGGTDGAANYADAPAYTTTEFASFTSPTNTGDFVIDITDYIKTLPSDTENIAFRIDVKEQNTNNSWTIGSCSNGTPPKVVLEYDDPSVMKTDVTVNIKNNGNVIKTYTDRVKDVSSYTLTSEQCRYIRDGNDIYYLPSDTQTTFDIDNTKDTAEINVDFEKMNGENIAMFEDFNADKEYLEKCKLTGTYTVSDGKAVLTEEENITIPTLGITTKVECDITGDITVNGTGITSSIEDGHLTAQGDVIIGFSGIGTIDNLIIKPLNTAFENLENGTYTLSASVRRYNLSDTAYIYAKTTGTPINRASIAGNDTWRKTVIQGIEVTDGKCEIGFSGAAQIADIKLEKETTANRAEFLTGGDITEVSYVESCGGKYYDEQGNQADPIQLLAERGFNLARVRVYNNPGKGRGDGTYYLPEGFQNVEDGLSLSKRAKDKGMQVQLTLYYSDYWADGSRQLIPNDWIAEIEGLSEEDKITKLGELIYTFTKDVMEKMKAQGTTPEYVSLGNEMQGGLLYGPDYSYGRKGTNNFKNLAYFLNQGAKAVREVAPDSKIVIHLDGKMSQYQGFFDKCKSNEVDYDVIGPSYYPFWTNNTVDEIVTFYNGLINRYDKDILVMETGYNFNPTKPDGYAGQLADNGPYNNIYQSSPEGQRAFMEEVFQGLRQVSGGRCIGDLYWDPMMINHEGVGWAMKESDDKADINVVPNTTLFDFDGKALPAFDAYKTNGYTPNMVGIGGTIKGANDKTVSVEVNDVSYDVNTDKMGGYFMRVPYADTISVSIDDAVEQPYTLDMKNENLKIGLDFTVIEFDGLTNSSFEEEFIGTEDWSFTNKNGWYGNTATRDNSVKFEGEYSVKLNNGNVGQRVTLEVGKTYRLSTYIKGVGKLRLGVGDGTQEFPASNFVSEQEFNAGETWQEQSIDFICTNTQDYVICVDSWDSTENYIDNITLTELTNIITSFEVSESENGVDYTVNYLTNKKNAVLYVALYDETGILVGCIKDTAAGSFNTELANNKEYTAKAFLWDSMKPIDMKTDTFVCGE